jgi:uncharacterized protein YegP (UPF0339 family)
METVEFYEDQAGEWRWRLRGANGEIVADSGEGYTRERDAVRAFLRVGDLIRSAVDSFLHEGIEYDADAER